MRKHISSIILLFLFVQVECIDLKNNAQNITFFDDNRNVVSYVEFYSNDIKITFNALFFRGWGLDKLRVYTSDETMGRFSMRTLHSTVYEPLNLFHPGLTFIVYLDDICNYDSIRMNIYMYLHTIPYILVGSDEDISHYYPCKLSIDMNIEGHMINNECSIDRIDTFNTRYDYLVYN